MSTQRKLRLDVQDLQVESFDPTVRAAGGRGTVFGQNLTQQINCYTFNLRCNSMDTCQGTCLTWCYETCASCPTVAETEDVTCLNATCYWAGGMPFYDANC